MKRFCLSLFCAMVALTMTAAPAFALPSFSKIFKTKYGANGEAIVKLQKCNVCHDKDSKDKGDRNAFGKKLAELIPGDAKDRLAEYKEQGDDAYAAGKVTVDKEFMEALIKVEKMESPDGGTYLDRINAGKGPTE